MLFPSFLSLFSGFSLLFLILILLFLYKVIIVPSRRVTYYKKQGLPGYFYPLLGMIKRGIESERLHKDSMYYYKDLAQKDPNVRAEVFNYGSRVCLALYDPMLIKEFYNNQSNYPKERFSGLLMALQGTGLFYAEGQLWKNHRKIISNIFHFEFLKQNVPVMVATVRESFQELKATPMKNVRIMDEIQKITGEIVGRVFFGERLNHYKIDGMPLTLYLASMTAKFGKAFRNPLIFLTTFVGLNPEWVPMYKQHMNEIREFRKFCTKIVDDRRNSQTKGNDLLGLLLETQKSANAEDRFSDEDIINEFVTFFFAGMDTTGHLITMVLYQLTKHPEYLEKLDKEIDHYYNQTDPVTIDSLNKMDTLHGILKETLRFYTPTPTIFPRVAQSDHNLLDIKVMKGMTVRPTPLYNMMNEKYFEEPMKFKPERWVNKKDFAQPFVDIPFSAGARNCIGQHLAMIESKIIVSEFVKMFNFKVVPEDYELVMTMVSLYEPKKALLMDLDTR